MYKIHIPMNIRVNDTHKTIRRFDAIYIDLDMIERELGQLTRLFMEQYLISGPKALQMDIPIVLSLEPIRIRSCSRYVRKTLKGLTDGELILNRDRPRIFRIKGKSILVRPCSIRYISDKDGYDADIVMIPERMHNHPLLKGLSIYDPIVPIILYPDFVFEQDSRKRSIVEEQILFYNGDQRDDIHLQFILYSGKPCLYYFKGIPYGVGIQYHIPTEYPYTTGYSPRESLQKYRTFTLNQMHIIHEGNSIWIDKIKHYFSISNSYCDILIEFVTT